MQRRQHPTTSVIHQLLIGLISVGLLGTMVGFVVFVLAVYDGLETKYGVTGSILMTSGVLVTGTMMAVKLMMERK